VVVILNIYRFEGIRYGVAKDIAQVIAAMCAFA
jgi:hypothetical protein